MTIGFSVRAQALCSALLFSLTAPLAACGDAASTGFDSAHRSSATVHPFHEILASGPQGTQTGAQAVAAIQAALDQHPMTDQLVDRLALASDPANYATFYQHFSIAVDADPASLDALADWMTADTKAEKQEAVLNLLVDGDPKFASSTIRGAVAVMLGAGMTKFEISAVFAQLTKGRINVGFRVPLSGDDGLVVVHPRDAVAAGSAITVWIHGDVNDATADALQRSAQESDASLPAPAPPEDEGEGGEGAADDGAAADDAGVSDEGGGGGGGNTTIIVGDGSSVVVGDDNETGGNDDGGGGGGGSGGGSGGFNMWDFLAEVITFGAAGTVIGTGLSVSTGNPGWVPAGAAFGGFVGAGKYMYGDDNVWIDGSDYCDIPLSLC